MNWAVLTASAGLAIIAAAGTLSPFVRRRHIPLEQSRSPLEDERVTILRALRRLDEDHAAGIIDDDDYRSLRRRSESQAVAVLRVIEEQDRSETQIRQLRDRRRASVGHNGGARAAVVRRGAVPFLVGTLLVALAGTALLAAGHTASVDESTTANAGSQAVAGSIDFFQQRVREHPQDVGARLDLAQRFLQAGQARAAISQYISALSLDHGNAEALATLGYLLNLAGKHRVGLRFVNRALAVDDSYPEALFYKGVILLKSEGKRDRATAYLERYIQAAPYGSHRAEADRLLASTGRDAVPHPSG